MMKCEYCKMDLLLIEVAIVRYIEHTEIFGYDYEAEEVDKGESECDEVLDVEPTHYMCSKCKQTIKIPASYGDVDNQIAVWLQFNSDYQKED